VYDRTTKADTYLALGVRELWIVDSSILVIEVRQAVAPKGKPVWEVRRYSQGDWAESNVLPGWRVSVDELFEGLAKE
jgi:Uma2 family endonuclease